MNWDLSEYITGRTLVQRKQGTTQIDKPLEALICRRQYENMVRKYETSDKNENILKSDPFLNANKD